MFLEKMLLICSYIFGPHYMFLPDTCTPKYHNIIQHFHVLQSSFEIMFSTEFWADGV